jgi:EAL domain-containing protein (putative c-di-GMP-specific phosphodiesterase class I)
VLAPRDGSDAGRLVQKAEAAMYFAKDQGKNRLCLFEPEIERQSARRVRMQGLLRVAAECNGFSFVAQSKVDANGLTVGAELLMRWSCAEFGVVSPAEFIPIAEQTGAIELMGRQALMQAAKLVAQANRRRAGVSIAVNVSPRQLQNGGLERLALRACALHGIEPGQLELELTESALATGLDAVTPLLQRLRAQGFVLSLDDFGTGYSSLSHLLHLPFHKVKIDRAFVRYLLEDERAREVVKGTLMICRGLGLTTVAEGVETSHQFVMLRELGVDEFQGYFFARPIPTEAWLDTLGHSEV